MPVEVGPRDLRQLPEFFGRKSDLSDYGEYDIEILAEINLAPRLSLEEILAKARRLSDDGADVIDLGCEPRSKWSGVGKAVKALRSEGYRVSIDSYNPAEIAPAVRAGAELVLSVNRTNVKHACDWGCEVVAVPDVPGTLEGLEQTLEVLDRHGVPLRIDPILNPIGLRVRREPRSVSGGPPAVAGGRDADGNRQSDRADRRRFGGHQRAALGILPGDWHPQRADHAGDQLGANGGAGMRSGAATGVLCDAHEECCRSTSSRDW